MLPKILNFLYLGGFEVDFYFFLLFLIEENGSYQEFFSEWKNIVSGS